MSTETIITCQHCGGKNRRSNNDALGIPACGHCKMPLDEMPFKLGEKQNKEMTPYAAPDLPPANVSKVKSKTLLILIVACVVLLVLNIIKAFILT
ncbi:hypothetical protein WDW89_13425 [Deltaproteobacteria bacterium TL4]